MQIELEIASGCLSDEIFTSFSVDPITYLIGQTGVIEVSPTWSNTVAGCPSEYNVYRLDDGVQRSLTPEESELVQQQNFDSGIVL